MFAGFISRHTAYGYASREQIDEAKRIQESADVVVSSEDKSPGEGERVLGEILISLGHTTKNRIAEAIRNLNYYRAEDERKAAAAAAAAAGSA